MTFDSYAGESFYNDKMQPVIDELQQKGLLIEDQGAKIVDLKDYGMPPAIILRSDGATLYADPGPGRRQVSPRHLQFRQVPVRGGLSAGSAFPADFQGAWSFWAGIGPRTASM